MQYRWFRNGNRIGGANGMMYRLVTADSGKRIKCRMVAGGLAASTSLNSPARLIG